MYKSSTKKNVVLREVARKTADKKGLFPDIDPNNAFGYGVIDCNSIVEKLLNPDLTTTTIAYFSNIDREKEKIFYYYYYYSLLT